MHPRPGLPHRSAPSGPLTATEGAQSCTLNPDYPTKTALTTTQPAPKAHHHAPSTPVASPIGAIWPPNRHRGNRIMHPRPQLPHRSAPSAPLTATEGAPSCTLDSDWTRGETDSTAQPAPREQHRAPSTEIRQGKRRVRRGNRRRGNTTVHPRRRRAVQSKTMGWVSDRNRCFCHEIRVKMSASHPSVIGEIAHIGPGPHRAGRTVRRARAFRRPPRTPCTRPSTRPHDCKIHAPQTKPPHAHTHAAKHKAPRARDTRSRGLDTGPCVNLRDLDLRDPSRTNHIDQSWKPL